MVVLIVVERINGIGVLPSILAKFPMPSTPDETAFNPQAFEQDLEQVERSLQALKERYHQVTTDQQRQQALQERLTQVQQQLSRDRSRSLQQELNRIKNQLDELEVALESHLFSWNGFKEVFWQAVRFAGLGMILGWVLRSCAA